MGVCCTMAAVFTWLCVIAFQTRILVTHGISFLPQADQIVVLQDGRISEVYRTKLCCFHCFSSLYMNRIWPRARLQESFRPGGKPSRDELISVPGNFLVSIYMVLCRDELVLGWPYPGSKNRDELTSRDSLGRNGFRRGFPEVNLLM